MTTITLSRQRHRLIADCLADRVEPIARSPRFTIYNIDPEETARSKFPDPGDIVLVHDFMPHEIDNNIARFVADELVPLLVPSPQSGQVAHCATREQQVFEHFVGEIVRSMDGNSRDAWHLFYDNTLAAMQKTDQQEGGANGGNTPPQDFIADFAAIYRRVADLVAEVAPATLFDAATCFGFLPLLLATDHWIDRSNGQWPCRVFACDINPALVSLAEGYARYRQLTNVRFVLADILARDMAHELAPLAASFDVVTAIHLLEHLEPDQTAAAVDALWSLARQRLIIAVPVEKVPDARFGHRQVFVPESLGALGQRTDGAWHGFEDHGAWLVVDRTQN